MAQKSKHIKLRIQKRSLPNGRSINLEIIEHPGAALIIPFLDKNHIVFIRQFRPVVDEYLYELPAGTLDKRESAIVCARREIIEETGYKAGILKYFGKIYPVPGYSTEVISIFKAEKLSRREVCREPDEIIETRIFNKSFVRRLFKEGKIIDAKTICALAFCGWI